MDFQVICDPKAAGWERGLAGVSLSAGVCTAGFMPNIGPFLRGGKRVAKVADALSHVDEAADAVKAIKGARKAVRPVFATAKEAACSFLADCSVGGDEGLRWAALDVSGSDLKRGAGGLFRSPVHTARRAPAMPTKKNGSVHRPEGKNRVQRAGFASGFLRGPVSVLS